MPYASSQFIPVGFDNGTNTSVMNIAWGPGYFGSDNRTIQAIINGSGTNEIVTNFTSDTVYMFEAPYGLIRRVFMGSSASTYPGDSDLPPITGPRILRDSLNS
jgi:hypothetical protein